MALYHTYRPQTFADMVETQPEVAHYFSTALQKGSLGHIYLFVGSHGIGKTSSARILAKAVNCLRKEGALPCNECENCTAILNGSFVDVYELDAASHRGIDDVRALQDVIRLAPVVGKQKVYIIDEVHMLTTEAFNALLKTFEEPPAQRLFLLCTTELHKVPTTIQSRAQVIHLQKPSDQKIAAYVTQIVSAEGGSIEPRAALLLAQAADGAFRDAAKLVENQFVFSKEITAQRVEQMLTGGVVSPHVFVQDVRDKAIDRVKTSLQQLEKSGSNIPFFIRACLAELREHLYHAVDQQSVRAKDVQLIRSFQQALVDTKYSPIPVLPLELAVFDYLSAHDEKVAAVSVVRKESSTPAVTSEKQKDKVAAAKVITSTVTGNVVEELISVEKVVVTESLTQEPLEKAPPADLPTAPPEFERIRERWKEVVALVKDSNASVASVLRISPPHTLDGNALIISTTYKFHKDRLEAQKNRALVEGALYELFGIQMRINCQLVQQSPRKKDVENVTSVADEGLVEAAIEIFAS